MKIFNIFFILLFVFCAALQYNDPDPYLWMPIYLYGAVLCYLALNKKFFLSFYLAGFAFYFVYAGVLFLSETGVLAWIKKHNAENIMASMQATKPWIEETREFLGLMLLIFALGVNMVWLLRLQRKEVRPAIASS